MRHWTSAALALLLSALAPAALAAPSPKPVPVAAKPQLAIAIVNGTPILRADFDRMLNQTKKRYAARMGIDFTTDRGKQMEQEIRTSLVDHLIERQLIMNEAARRKLSVSDVAIASKLAELKAGLPSEVEFQQALKGYGMTLDELKHEIHDGLMIQAVAEAIAPGSAVTDEDAAAYYQAHVSEYERPEEVRVRHILVKDQAKAEDLLKQLKAGGSFEALAKAHSEDPGSGAQGGDLGFFTRGRMVPEFETAAFALKPDELSGLVKSQFGYHIIKGVEHRDARRVPLAEVQTELKDKLGRERKDTALSTWLVGQKKQAKVVYGSGFDPNAPKPAAKPTVKPSAKPTTAPKRP